MKEESTKGQCGFKRQTNIENKRDKAEETLKNKWKRKETDGEKDGAQGNTEEIRAVIYCVGAGNSEILQADQRHSTASTHERKSAVGLVKAALAYSAIQSTDGTSGVADMPCIEVVNCLCSFLYNTEGVKWGGCENEALSAEGSNPIPSETNSILKRPANVTRRRRERSSCNLKCK
jgi:hypothetical protein